MGEIVAAIFTTHVPRLMIEDPANRAYDEPVMECFPAARHEAAPATGQTIFYFAPSDAPGATRASRSRLPQLLEML